MVSIAKAAEVIDANTDIAGIAGSVPDEEIWVAEKRLGLTFPNSYKEFLKKYGSLLFNGEPVYGLGVPDDDLPNVIFATEQYRTLDDFFPGDIVVIQDTGAGDLLCLATSRLNDDGECPVVQYIPEMSFEEQMFEVVNSTFAHFLLAVARRGTGGR